MRAPIAPHSVRVVRRAMGHEPEYVVYRGNSLGKAMKVIGKDWVFTTYLIQVRHAGRWVTAHEVIKYPID